MQHTWVPVAVDMEDSWELFDEIRENGRRIGSVQRFSSDGSTYAWADGVRLGGFTEDGLARLAVVRALSMGRDALVAEMRDRFGCDPITNDSCA